MTELETLAGAYAVLGLDRGATIQEIKGAYRRLALRWHPDRFSDPLMRQRAIAQMKRINAAYALAREGALDAQEVKSQSSPPEECVLRQTRVYSHAAVYVISRAEAVSPSLGLRLASGTGILLWGILVFWVLLGVMLNLHDFFFVSALPMTE